MASGRDKEIEQVRRAEIKRGRKQPTPAESANRTRLQILIKEGTEEEFAAALIARGWRRDSPAFADALAAFRTVQRQHRSRS